MRSLTWRILIIAILQGEKANKTKNKKKDLGKITQ